MLRGGGMNSSPMALNKGMQGINLPSKRPVPLRKESDKNPIATATKGAERYALNNYGKTLVDRANNTGEELK